MPPIGCVLGPVLGRDIALMRNGGAAEIEGVASAIQESLYSVGVMKLLLRQAKNWCENLRYRLTALELANDLIDDIWIDEWLISLNVYNLC